MQLNLEVRNRRTETLVQPRFLRPYEASLHAPRLDNLEWRAESDCLCASRWMTMGCCPGPRHLFPKFGTGVGCFVLEEALGCTVQHAGRKADRRRDSLIPSFGCMTLMALRVRGSQEPLPAFRIFLLGPRSRKKFWRSNSNSGFGGKMIPHWLWHGSRSKK